MRNASTQGAALTGKDSKPTLARRARCEVLHRATRAAREPHTGGLIAHLLQALTKKGHGDIAERVAIRAQRI
ncbi:hypothetical protein, partial [Escherichia coli]|uniref:hypothetical protein n=2 Tax=Gammaproteobacteria TaxID=1236 RepID=UPI001AD94BC4